MNGQRTAAHGIAGSYATELRADFWRDAKGESIDSLTLEDLSGGFTLLYFFQSWCPGCHQSGFPTLQAILQGTRREHLRAAAIQTVFEGFESNTPDKAWELQGEHQLNIPFGHDGVDGTRSAMMDSYRSGGTPWFVLIDPRGVVLANEFHVNGDGLVEFVNRHVESLASKAPG